MTPLSKTDYSATGRIDAVSALVIQGQKVTPRFTLWIVDKNGLGELTSKPGPPTRGYGLATYPDKPDFAVQKPDYDGTYYFCFQIDQSDLTIFGQPMVSISLTENWSERTSERELQLPQFILFLILLISGVYFLKKRKKIFSDHTQRQ